MKAYRIRDWATLFENSRSRCVKILGWVPVPNRHDGEGFGMVMAHERAAEIYAAWHLMLQVSSRCHPRGSLLRDDGTPLTPSALAIKTRGRAEWFEIAMPFLVIGPQWLEEFDVPDCHPPVTRVTPARHPSNGTPQEMAVEGKGTEGKGREGEPTRARAQTWPDLPEVKTLAGMRNIPEPCAVKWWSECDARGGCDRNGQPIVKWQSSLQAFAVTWRGNDQARAGNGGMNGAMVVVRQQEMERCYAQIKTIRDSYESHQTMTTEDRTKISTLKTRLAELKTELGCKT